jgi:hypothetical protein
MKKMLFVCGLAAMAICCTGFADAASVDDDTGDVFHWQWSDNLGRYSWAHAVSDKPNIDITEMSYDVSGNTLTLTMSVSGDIEDAEDVWYWAYYNTTEATYYMNYVNGSGTCMGTGANNFSFGNVSAAGDMITGTVDLLGTDTTASFWGWAASGYTQATSGEYWQDWAPQEYAPDLDGGNGGDDGNGGTPGFTVLLALGCFAAVLVIFRARRR